MPEFVSEIDGAVALVDPLELQPLLVGRPYELDVFGFYRPEVRFALEGLFDPPLITSAMRRTRGRFPRLRSRCRPGL